MTKKEIISKHVLSSNIFYNYHASENVLDTTRISTIEKIMQEYSDQQTANLFTKEEVQKIVERVKRECLNFQLTGKKILDLDINQFIKK